LRAGGRQPAQALVLTAFALVALLAFVGLVLNMGLFLVERRHLQNAADGMALAATWRVLDERTSRVFLDSAVLNEAQRLATQNQVALGTDRTLTASYVDQQGNVLGRVGGGSMPSTSAGVRISLDGPFGTLIPGFVGQNVIQVNARSEARLVPVAPPPSLSTVVPIAVPLASYLSTGATTYDLASFTNPFLDLSSVGSGGTSAPSYGDMHMNLQYWSDGSHAVGALTVGSTAALAGPGYASDVQVGLLDNARRQNLPNDAAYAGLGVPQYILISLPVCQPCSDPSVTVVGFVRFNLARSQITSSSLVGWFVSSVDDPASVARQTGPVWGPSIVALTL